MENGPKKPENKLVLFEVVRHLDGTSHYEAYEIEPVGEEVERPQVRYGAERYNFVDGKAPFVGLNLPEIAQVLWQDRARRCLLMENLPAFLAFAPETYALVQEAAEVSIRFGTEEEISAIFRLIDRIDKKMLKKVCLN